MNYNTRVIFIGAGNLATNLANAMHRAGIEILQVYSHTAESAMRLTSLLGSCSFTNDLSAIRCDADVYIYALKDSVLTDVQAQIHAPQALHLHTAGSMPLSVFDSDKPHAGVFYPFQSFTKARLLSFDTLPIFLEARMPEDYPALESLAGMITSQVFHADSAVRKRLHLAGVFANNFTNCLYRIGGDILRETGIPESVLLNLIDETAAKIHTIPPLEAQTGPSKRWDENVMAEHISLLHDDDLKQLYTLFSKNIHEHA